MKDNDFDSPVSVGRIFRGFIGAVFLIFAIACGLVVMGSLVSVLRGDFHSPTLFYFSTAVVCAISLGYTGFRLIVVSDNERLLGRIVSLVGAHVFMGGAVGILWIEYDYWGAELPLLISALFFIFSICFAVQALGDLLSARSITSNNDADSRVSARKRRRCDIGAIFLIFAIACGLVAIGSLVAILGGNTHPYTNLSFFSVATVYAIGFGYVGFRLIVVSDNERLLNRVASFVGAFLFTGIGIAVYSLLTGGDSWWGMISFAIGAFFSYHAYRAKRSP